MLGLDKKFAHSVKNARDEIMRDRPMAHVVIPAKANSVPCPNCGLVIHNLAKFGVRHQVDCACGTKVIVERRRTNLQTPKAERSQSERRKKE